jgi:hypothetical protein
VMRATTKSIFGEWKAQDGNDKNNSNNEINVCLMMMIILILRLLIICQLETDRKCYLADMQEVTEEKSGDNLSS